MTTLFLWAPDGATTAAAPGDSPKPRKARGTFNTQYLDELADAEKVGKAAQKATYAALLQTDWDISPARVSEFLTLVTQTGTILRGAKTSRDDKEVSTADKTLAERRILAAIRRVQAGARTKFGGDTTQLKRFFVGTDLEKNEEQLDKIGESLLEILATETLPGVKSAQIQELTEALAAWNDFDEQQGEHNAAGVAGTAQTRSNMTRINATRRQIQSAIDGEFPFIAKHENPPDEGARVAAREAFALPLNHPMK